MDCRHRVEPNEVGLDVRVSGRQAMKHWLGFICRASSGGSCRIASDLYILFKLLSIGLLFLYSLSLYIMQNIFETLLLFSSFNFTRNVLFCIGFILVKHCCTFTVSSFFFVAISFLSIL